MKLYEQLGEPARDFLQWAVEDLAAYAMYAYDPSDNTFWATLIDGTRMHPEDGLPRGYVSPRSFSKRPASGQHLWAYALAYKHGGGPLMWDMARQIAAGLGLGQLGATAADGLSPDMQTTCADAKVILALLELHQAIGDRRYLALACKVADNLIEREFHKGFFVDSPDHLFAKFNNTTPLALLYLHAALSGATVELPLYPGSRSYFTCIAEDKGRTNAQRVIYAKLRE